MRELRWYNMSVGAIQETKWFGNDIWQEEGYTLLHSGQPMPSDHENAIRREGVGIALDEKATAAWRAAGEAWEAVSSRIVTARLKLARRGQRIPCGSSETHDTFVTVISAYAPTAKASPHVKQQFVGDLQNTVDKVPVSDVLVLLGDFNAHVGRRDPGSDLWQEALGLHGLSERNEAGEEFLEFCTINQFTTMNTWFQKKEIHLGTWMHPATKKHHIIDFVVRREGQRMFCTDVRVMRGANCWSDHQMVRTKLWIKTIFSPRDKGKPTVPFATYLLQNSAFRDDYRENLTEKLLAAPHDSESKAEQNWETLKSCILKAGEETVGQAKKSQPDWFLESNDTLQPLIDGKNKAHNQMI